MRLDNPRKLGLACTYCGGPATDWDHVIPRAKGGLTVPKNLVPACGYCNSWKRDKSLPVQHRMHGVGKPWARLVFYTSSTAGKQFKLGAQARRLTQGEYLTMLIDLHDKAKVMADAGNPTIRDLLLELQLQTVTVVG